MKELGEALSVEAFEAQKRGAYERALRAGRRTQTTSDDVPSS